MRALDAAERPSRWMYGRGVRVSSVSDGVVLCEQDERGPGRRADGQRSGQRVLTVPDRDRAGSDGGRLPLKALPAFAAAVRRLDPGMRGAHQL